MKRELTQDEKNRISKNLIIIKDDLEGLERIDIAKKELAIDTAEIEVRRQMKALTQELKKLKNEAEVMKNTIAILEDQLENGVEIIEPAKEVE